MLKDKQLINKVHDGRICVRFEVLLTFGDGLTYPLQYQRQRGVTKEWLDTWTLSLDVPRTLAKDTEVFRIMYSMPRSGLPLTLVAATGMKHLQYELQEEVAQKNVAMFEIGNMTEGM